MLKHGNNVTGVVLRGISMENALNVINLGKIRDGKLDYLRDGERMIPGLKPDLADLPESSSAMNWQEPRGLPLRNALCRLPLGHLHADGMVPRMKPFLVVGIFESGFYEYDTTLAYIS